MASHVVTTAYGRPALEALLEVVAGIKADDPMAPVTVLVPNNVAGIVARRFLAHGTGPARPGVAGIHFSTLPRLAEQLASPTLTAQGRRPATRPVSAAVIRRRLDDDGGVFTPVAAHPSTSRAIAAASTALRDVDDATLAALTTTSTLVADLVRVHREVVADLAPRRYDRTDLLTTATDRVRHDDAATAGLGPVVLYLPQDLTRAETAFAKAIADRTELCIVAGLTGDTAADRCVLDATAALAPGFRPSEALPAPLAARVLHASDSDDEVRCVVREVVTTLQSVPAHRVAVLYAAASPYARLLHEHLGAAGIATNGPGTRPVSERAVSRFLLGLFEARQGGLPRADVFRTLGEVSPRDFRGERISVSGWERVSREAGVVDGTHWDTRLAGYADAQDAAVERERAAADPIDSRVARAERNRDTATALHDFMLELRTRFDTGASTPTWAGLGDWALDIFRALLPPAAHLVRMPLDEQYAAGVIERTLTGLAALDETGAAPSLDGLVEVLGLELESALPRVGRFGKGVLVAPVTHAIGLDLEVVFLVGLSEDLLPGRLRDDSLLPERVRRESGGQMPSTRARVDAKHRALLAAFASAGRVVASFPRGDLRRHTQRLPSRWLLPTLRHQSGIPALAATEWERARGDWLLGSTSFAGSLLSTTALGTEQEWRARAAKARVELGDAAVDAAREMHRGRGSSEFTRFDGNLAGTDGLPDLLSGALSVSPTALERYALCPHEYFVQRMLRVSPVESPEEVLEISAMDFGNFVHECLDGLISEAGGAGRLPDFGAPWTRAQHLRLREIGEAKSTEYVAAGRAGHRLLWARARLELLATLDWMLTEDSRWRAEQGARVVASELAFGLDGQPAVEMQVDGGVLRFRGKADKVDERRDGSLLVTDVKSGSPTGFKGLGETNPVADGEKLQLPVYAHAARARHGQPTTPVEAMYWFVRKDRRRVQLPLTDGAQRVYAATVGLLARSLAAGVFPPRAPATPDHGWVTCPYCNPDGLGHSDVRSRWEAKRLAPQLVDYTRLVEPAAVPQVADEDDGGGGTGDGHTPVLGTDGRGPRR